MGSRCARACPFDASRRPPPPTPRASACGRSRPTPTTRARSTSRAAPPTSTARAAPAARPAHGLAARRHVPARARPAGLDAAALLALAPGRRGIRSACSTSSPRSTSSCPRSPSRRCAGRSSTTPGRQRADVAPAAHRRRVDGDAPGAPAPAGRRGRRGRGSVWLDSRLRSIASAIGPRPRAALLHLELFDFSRPVRVEIPERFDSVDLDVAPRGPARRGLTRGGRAGAILAAARCRVV